MRLGIGTALLFVLFSVSNVIGQDIAPALKEKTFVMAFIRPETQYFGKWQRLVHTEIFKRLGIKIEFRDYPPKRISMESDAGNIDGEAGRIYEYANDHPNLIRIEEMLFSMNFSAFTVNDSIPPLNGWESLRGTDYRVEYRRGIKICEINLPKVVSKKNLSDVTEIYQGLKKLVSDRIDLFVEEESGILTLLQTPEFKESKIRSAGLMGYAPLYAYLHKKYAALAPKMAEIIKAMKAEGLIEQYRIQLDKEFGFERN